MIVLTGWAIDMHPQTLAFIKASNESYQDDPYSVSRGNRDLDGWKDTLEREIQDAIDKDILGTPLEAFLDKGARK